MVQLTVQEGTSDIILTTMPSMGCSKMEEDADGVQMNRGRESVIIVNTRDLRESLCNKASLVSQDLTIWTIFDEIGPTATDGSAILREVLNCPGLPRT
jgi:hypothetical protein